MTKLKCALTNSNLCIHALVGLCCTIFHTHSIFTIGRIICENEWKLSRGKFTQTKKIINKLPTGHLNQHGVRWKCVNKLRRVEVAGHATWTRRNVSN